MRVIINRVKFDACTSSSFREVKTNSITLHLLDVKQRINLYTAVLVVLPFTSCHWHVSDPYDLDQFYICLTGLSAENNLFPRELSSFT